MLEFLDLRFVMGDEGLDKITSGLGFGWEFEAMLGNEPQVQEALGWCRLQKRL